MFCVEKYRNVETYCYICSQILFVEMEQAWDVKFYTYEEILDEDLDKIGTPERNVFERCVDEADYLFL